MPTLNDKLLRVGNRLPYTNMPTMTRQENFDFLKKEVIEKFTDYIVTVQKTTLNDTANKIVIRELSMLHANAVQAYNEFALLIYKRIPD